jgi:hypothetical protein
MSYGYKVVVLGGVLELFAENWPKAVETAMEMSVLYGENVDIYAIGSDIPCWQIPAWKGDG